MLYWTLPHYREPLWIELIIDDMLRKIAAFVKSLVRGTRSEYWLLEREGQAAATFFTLMLCSLVWLIALEYSTHRSKRIAPMPPSAADVEPADSPAHETPIMKKLAPPGHRPTNAKLNISPFHLARGFAEAPFTSFQKANNRPDLVAAGSADREFRTGHDELPITLPLQGRNFETLQKQGLLDKNEPPMKQYAARKRLVGLTGEKRK
jgi:hypothetical protein